MADQLANSKVWPLKEVITPSVTDCATLDFVKNTLYCVLLGMTNDLKQAEDLFKIREAY